LEPRSGGVGRTICCSQRPSVSHAKAGVPPLLARRDSARLVSW
jgi:hypothetical protein